MRIYEATNLRINELRMERRMSEYALIYQTGMPPDSGCSATYSTV